MAARTVVLLLLHIWAHTDTAKGAEVVSQLLEAPLPLCTLGFAALLGGVCYLAPPRALDVINTLLVVGVVASFAVRCLSCL